jgi:SAM-dependent methyltransferase
MWLTEAELEATAVVANCSMNRERELTGTNGYDRELGFDLVEWLRERPDARWLDVCCGSGRALLQAEQLLPDVRIVGLDLVDFFWPHQESRVRFVVGPLREYVPEGRFDLITSVHGLHYVGDKLGALERLRGWLVPGGRLVAHLDPTQVLVDGSPRSTVGMVRRAGFAWNGRKHLVEAVGPAGPLLGVRFLGARPAGPNFTGQPAVESAYAG